MKVNYDISLLGRGHYDPINRTGTFRVVENMAYGLAASKEIDLSFCVSQSLRDLNASLDYLQCNSKLKIVPFDYPKQKKYVVNKLYSQIDHTVNKLNQVSKPTLPVRALIKCLNKANNLVENYISPLDSKFISNVDIFHSPCFALTPQVKQTKAVKKFVTIYDLIPILCPQFFDFDAASTCKNIIKSLAPDDWVICISEATQNDLCNYSKDIDPARVFVTPLAAAPDVFYPCSNSEEIASIRKKYNIPDAPYILSLCTLEPRKNIDHVIRCFAKLVQEQNIKDLYLVLVGTKGWSYDKIFQELTNFDIAKDRIIITGYVADEDLAALYSGALAFAYLSFYEGFGLPPLEAMQCGIPVITSNTSSLPEVVGNAGIMLEPLDTDGLCQSMLELYSNSSLRENMSLKSIKQAKQFSWEKCTQETVAAYKTALPS